MPTVEQMFAYCYAQLNIFHVLQQYLAEDNATIFGGQFSATDVA